MLSTELPNTGHRLNDAESRKRLRSTSFGCVADAGKRFVPRTSNGFGKTSVVFEVRCRQLVVVGHTSMTTNRSVSSCRNSSPAVLPRR